MARLIYAVATSHDGFIAGADGSLAWLRAYDSADEDYGQARFLDGIDGLVMGRRAYEMARAFPGDWPYGDRPAWVLSRSLSTPADAPAGVRFTREPPKTLAARWRALGRKQVWLVGGADVAAQFLAAGLIDELLVTRVPVTLGSGLAPFGPGAGEAMPAGFELARSLPLARGLVQECWRRAS